MVGSIKSIKFKLPRASKGGGACTKVSCTPSGGAGRVHETSVHVSPPSCPAEVGILYFLYYLPCVLYFFYTFSILFLYFGRTGGSPRAHFGTSWKPGAGARAGAGAGSVPGPGFGPGAGAGTRAG